jgi:hypothetical protein
MPADVRIEFERAPRSVQEAYLAWWAERPNKAAAHRDTWPSFSGGWTALARRIHGILGPAEIKAR